MALPRLALVLGIACAACTVPVDDESGAPDAADSEIPASGDDAGVAADATASADATVAPGPCAGPVVESWQGTARRRQTDGYPDSITATITWTRTSTVDCVDTYAPSGTATYGYGIPGALCSQWITPASQAVAAADGWLTIDRSTSPPTFAGHGATFWTIVHHCEYDDGTSENSEQDGGAIWFDATGPVVDGAFGGTLDIDYGTPDVSERCGPHGIPPCEYTWQFDPS